MLLDYYLEQLDYNNLPDFFKRYLEIPSLLRLKKIGYFCGMDYASKSIYDFKEPISRYTHSLTTSLLTYKLTKNKIKTLSALYHDVATPCFSHVIDYINKDYEKQESTKEYAEYILKNDALLNKYLKEDNIDIKDIINFKKYSIVDNDRPKSCADRIDELILTGISWTKDIDYEDIKNIIDNICIYKNENNEEEIGFKNIRVIKRIIEINKNIDEHCHYKEYNYMMNLLANIISIVLKKNYIKYEDLYKYNEEEIFDLFNKQNDKELERKINEFQTTIPTDIPNIEIPKTKIRELSPLYKGRRYN